MYDWPYFENASQCLLHGHSPYCTAGVYNPPWLFVLLIPFVLLPTIIITAVPFIALAYAAYRKHNPALMPVVGLSVPFMILVRFGNVDWVPMLGTLSFGYLPPLLLAVKPQAAGLALLAYLHRNRIKYLIPLAVALAVSYALFGWPLSVNTQDVEDMPHNLSLTPYSIPLGAYAAWRAWRGRSLAWGCAASLALSPYWALYSLVPLWYKVGEKNIRTGAVLTVLGWVYVLAWVV